MRLRPLEDPGENTMLTKLLEERGRLHFGKSAGGSPLTSGL